jgi:DNA-directed RNA polymerase specialized sigma24 family protein
MLQELSKKDKLWRNIAFNICKNKFLADEIVQEMYLRFHRNPKDEVNDYYVALVLKSVYLNMLKEKTNASINSFHYIEDTNIDFEPNDKEQAILDEIDNLTWTQKELLAEVYDRSYREIESIYNINYGYSYLQIKKAKEKVWQNLEKRK